MKPVKPTRPLQLLDIAATRQRETATAATLPPHTLMKRAGLSVARLGLAVAPHARTVWLACGPGNNGGDGLEAAMHLRQWGCHPVVTWIGRDDDAPEDARASWQRARDAGVRFLDQPPDDLGEQDLCIDALLGIGATRPPDGQMAQWIATMNASVAGVLAVDVPSGLSADTGQPISGASTGEPLSMPLNGQPVVVARHTLTLLAAKPGLFTARGRDYAGVVWIDDLGANELVGQACACVNPQPPEARRLHASHKGSYGDVAVIGGEGIGLRGLGMTGAALLAARAALYGGAGRVMVSLLDDAECPTDFVRPELMFRRIDALDLQAITVVCGCGGGEAVRIVLPLILSRSLRLVLDADALNALATDSSLRQLLRQRAARGLATVLTPHPLEAARLLHCTSAEVMADRLRAANALAIELQAVVVLKGSGSIIAAPAKKPMVNLTGNALLAAPGTGDVLAGWIGARMAAGEDAWEAASRSVYHHGSVADHWPAAQTLTAGMLAERAFF